jgi:hypothetical protein
MISRYNYIAEISEKRIKKIYSLNGKAHLLKGGYDGFINFLKTEDTWTDYICSSNYEDAVILLKKLLHCFKLKKH